MVTVVLYSRTGCHLCEQTAEELGKLKERYPHELRIVDIGGHRELQKKYALDIPVVEIGPYRLKYPFTNEELQVTLSAAIHRAQQIEQIQQTPSRAGLDSLVQLSKADKFSFWLAKHYMAVFNGIVFLYLGFAFLAPILMHLGYVNSATLLYKAYGMVCHQLSFRSWFLFGEQAAYPRTAAGVKSLIPYKVAIGLDENDLLNAREFIGNPIVGYKIALCQRDVAIYSGILVFGLIFSLTNRRIKPLPWYLWIVLGILPVGFDGLSQLFSQPPFSAVLETMLSVSIPYRESTPALRTLTGGLFGFTTAWFGYPMVEESMIETRNYVLSKMSTIEKQKNAQG